MFRGLNSLDGGVMMNKRYSIHLELLLRKELSATLGTPVAEISDTELFQAFERLVDRAMADPWHKKNLTGIKYLYYNFNKILGK